MGIEYLLINLYFCQVGAIVLYTYVFQMLSPPPGGSFDCTKERALPIQSLLPDPPPEQVPLLKEKESEPLDRDASNKGKVGGFFSIFLQSMLPDPPFQKYLSQLMYYFPQSSNNFSIFIRRA